MLANKHSFSGRPESRGSKWDQKADYIVPECHYNTVEEWHFNTIMSLKRLIDVSTVAQLLKNNIINKEGVKILDCTYDHSLVKKKPDWKHFQKELYGKFEKILAHPCP
ncbi:hypothetical protein TELCIR_12235 [Teladorsagia circumcincta]|uniref:Uncharacterized protein n=1 Tax=Teladorsagia circumcincta TaxID=45464 RepID=A0A2G9U7A0_TELCI|nr:hypothetical protein TELCIR_12235 [Teladorsagia circumcincta]